MKRRRGGGHVTRRRREGMDVTEGNGQTRGNGIVGGGERRCDAVLR